MTSLRWPVAALGGLCLAVVPLQESAKEPAKDPKAPLERAGTLIPANASEMKLVLESFAGPLEIVEISAHGSQVREGDVLARLETKGIDEAIAAAERDLRSTEIRHQNSREQAKLDEETAANRLEAATDAFNDAQEALANYEKIETALKKRGEELSVAAYKDRIDDQKDELAQLEKMYTADELTDATEEIVLRRNRRDLARSQASFDLQSDRRKYDNDYTERKSKEAKQKVVRDAQRGLDRTQRQIEIEKRARADSLARLDPELKDAKAKVEKLKRDRDHLTLRAPSSGIVLHGARDDYRPGRSAPRYDVGGNVAAKATLFTIAQPGALQVALEIPESQILVLSQGMAAKVVANADPSLSMVGRLRYERFPTAKSGGGPESTFDGTVELNSVAPSLVAGMRCKVVLEGAKK